jgi:hypothetical protein
MAWAHQKDDLLSPEQASQGKSAWGSNAKSDGVDILPQVRLAWMSINVIIQ